MSSAAKSRVAPRRSRHSDRRGQLPELESVVQGEPEPVRPVKQHEDEQAQQDQPGEPMADDGVQMVVVGPNPFQGNCQSKSTIRMARTPTRSLRRR